MKETTVRLSHVVSREFITPDEDIPPELVERMAKAISDRIERDMLLLLNIGSAAAPPRAVGITIHNVS